MALELTEENYRFLDIAIKISAFMGAAYSVYLANNTFKLSTSESRIQTFNKIHSTFLDPNILATRREIIQYWSSKVVLNPKLKEFQLGGIFGSKFSKIPNKDLKSHIRSKYGIEYKHKPEDLKNTDFNRKMDEVLNKYEHLGKMREASLISKDDVRLTF
ncbi:MAG: hypothetical protein OEZ04_12295 [Nitrospinota bacterium]|nr:hypothetical protein [Nitrospinota bacterium]